MKKIYAEPMTKVMKLNAASIMGQDIPDGSGNGGKDPNPSSGDLSLF